MRIEAEIDMDQIDQKHLDRLQDSGLFVSHPLAAFGGGVWVVKPTTTKGHYIPEYSAGYIAIGDEPVPPDTNAPMTAFYRQNSAWVVNIKPSTGSKMEPDEFLHEWESPEEAVDDILDFYFGDSSRMIKLAHDHGKFLGRSEAFKSTEAESQSKNS